MSFAFYGNGSIMVKKADLVATFIPDLAALSPAEPPDDPEELLKMIGDLMERIRQLEQPCPQCAIRHDAQVKLADLLAEQKAENETLRGRLERLTPSAVSPAKSEAIETKGPSAS
jgi:hypothetical protein